MRFISIFIVLLLFCSVLSGCKKTKAFNAEVILSEAVVQAKEGKWAIAYKKVKELVSRTPENSAAQIIYGLCLEHQDNPNDALKAFLAAAKQEPDFYSFYHLGRMFHKLGNYNDSIEPLKQAIELDETNLEAKILLAESFMKQKQFKKAIVLYQDLAKTERFARSSFLYNQLGVSYLKANLNVNAFKALKKSYELDSTNHIGVFNLAVLIDLKFLKHRKVAVKYYKHYLSLIENNSELQKRAEEVKKRIAQISS